MKRRVRNSFWERGDTIIEVLLATAVFSAVAVGALVVMNRSAAITQRALEVTQTRQQIDAQAELLRYVHSMRVSGADGGSAWSALKQQAQNNAGVTIDPSALADGSCRPIGSLPNSFAINPTTVAVRQLDGTSFLEPVTYARFDTAQNRSLGLWVQGKYVNASRSDSPDQRGAYIDFYIQACWNSVGSNVPVAIGTVVRLYDPEEQIFAGNGG